MLGAVLCAGLAPNILQIPYSSRAVVSGTMAKKIAEVGLNSRKGDLKAATIMPLSFLMLIWFNKKGEAIEAPPSKAFLFGQLGKTL